MAHTIVVNVPPYEGEYEIDINTRTFAYDEWRWIKRISGYMPLTIEQGWAGGDPDLILSLAIVAMSRAGKIEKKEVMEVAEHIESAEVDGVSISVKLEDEEVVEADPPKPSSPDAEKPSSGDDTAESTDASPESSEPSNSGIQDWATGSDSDRLTLAK